MPRLRFHNLNNGTNPVAGPAHLLCRRSIDPGHGNRHIYLVYAVRLLQWRRGYVLWHRCAIQSSGCGWYRCRRLDRNKSSLVFMDE